MADRDNAVHAHRPHITTIPTFSNQGHEPRATAQAHIAATAPKTTYGRCSNKLLPLTGNQFRRDYVSNNGISGVPISKSTLATSGYETSDADDSPLSDAEPSEKLTSLSLLRSKRKISERRARNAEDAPDAKQGTHQQGNLCVARTSPPSTDSEDQLIMGRQSRKPDRSSKKKAHPNTTSVRRSRLPLKELILVSGTEQDASFKQPPKQAEAMLSTDPISSSMQDAAEGIDEAVTPLKRKAQVSLSTIRKRLRTPTSNHKIVRKVQSMHKTAKYSATGNQSRLLIGDGFGEADLLSIRRPSSGTKGLRKRPHPNVLLQGMQALTLASGPFPDVQFEHCKTSQLELKGPCSKAEGEAHLQESEAQVAPGSAARNTQKSSRRQVSFSDNVDHFIAVQLSSVSAPRREPSVSLTDEDDEGEEGDDESEDEAAADTYLAGDESQSEDDEALTNHDTEASPEPMSLSNQSPYFPDYSGLAERHMNNPGVTLDFRRPRTPGSGSFPYASLSKRRLNEVNETIFDDYQVDDMLLENTARNTSSVLDPNSSLINISQPQVFFEREANNKPTSIPPLPQSNGRRKPSMGNMAASTAVSIATGIQPRSILKNNIPQTSSENNQPESTAANTRRNSVVPMEESRYFSQAGDQLASSSPSRDKILRKKSNTRTYAPIQVPFSDEIVPETSPRKEGVGGDDRVAAAAPARLLRRTSEAAWFSSTNQYSLPARDLRDLTRSVSKENGTLSQSVRRRRSMPFRSPVVGR